MIPCDSTGLWAGGLISGSTVTILGRPLGIVAVEREPLTPAGGYIITLDPNYAIDPLGLTWSVQGQDLVVATVAFPLSDTQLLVEARGSSSPTAPSSFPVSASA